MGPWKMRNVNNAFNKTTLDDHIEMFAVLVRCRCLEISCGKGTSFVLYVKTHTVTLFFDHCVVGCKMNHRRKEDSSCT